MDTDEFPPPFGPAEWERLRVLDRFCDLSFGRYNQDPSGSACRDARFTEKTMHRWLREPNFALAYREARRIAFKQAMSMTQRYAPLAIQTLAQVMTNDKSPASSRVSAAEAILKFSRDSIELDDLEGRLEALEMQARATVGQPPNAPAPTPTPPPPAPEPVSPPTASDDEQRRAA